MIFLMAALTLAPVGIAQAGGGGATFEWCPSPLPHADIGCAVGVSVQDVVTKAQAAHVPGTVFVNAGAFTGNVVAVGLNDVAFRGNANGGAGTTINGSISIFDSKNIIVSNFMVTGGISVENGSGTYLFSGNSGALTIKNSKFDKNTIGSGLQIMHNGDVSLMNVSASKNHDVGIILGAEGNILVTDVTASKNGLLGCNLVGDGTITVNATRSTGNRFDRNGLVGLVASTPEAITLTDVSAGKNGQAGLYATSDSSVAINANKSKMNKFDKNTEDGVYVWTPGAITLIDVSASGNGGDGAKLEGAPTSITIRANRSKSLHFDKNKGHGVEAGSSGPVILADVIASRNVGEGAHLGSGGGIAVHTVLSKLSRFERNGGYGITATSSGVVILRDVSASRNTSGGAFVGSGTGVSIITLNAKRNVFDKNLGHGLTVSATGSILMADVSASGNRLDGAHLSNSGIVTVKTMHATANKFDKNMGNGLFSSAGGAVTIEKSSANKNQINGLYMSTSNDVATVTCSVAKNNTLHDIQAALGTANLFLNSVTMTHPGQVDVSFAGTGVIMVASTSCP